MAGPAKVKMAARKRGLKSPSVSEFAKNLAESWLNGNRRSVVEEIGRLRSDYAAIVAVRVYDYLSGDDMYAANSFTRALEAATY